MTKRFYMNAIALGAAATFLTACGGGGSDLPATQVAPTPTPTPTAPIAGVSTLVNTITPANYVAGSEELAAFNLLNAERQRCGFGTLLQNAALDQAARAHADWQIINSTFSHNETSGTTGFTGFTPTDRAKVAGYVTFGTSVGEDLAFGTSNSTLGRGERGVRELFTGPYHAISLLSSTRDVGISVRAPSDVGKNTLIPVTELNFGTTTTFQLPATNEVLTYPCEGTSGVDFRLTGEEPNPVPGRNLFGLPLGHPVVVAVRRGQTLVIDNATMHRVSDGAVVVLRSPITGANDPNPGHYLSNEGYVIPDAPLSPSTNYAVTIDGTNNGAAFTRSFSFTTGTGG